MTIREQTIDHLVNAELAGIIISKARRDTIRLMEERDGYARDPKSKMREGFMERERLAWETISKAMPS